MTETRLEELMKNSLAVGGAKDLSAVIRQYLPVKKKLEKARSEWLSQLKVGDVVAFMGKAYPHEIVAFIPQTYGGPYVTLKDLQTGEIREKEWLERYCAPFDEGDVADIRYFERKEALKERFSEVLKSNDLGAIAKLEVALK